MSVTNFRKVYRCFFKSVNIWHSYKHEGGCLVHDVRLANTLLKIEKKVHDAIDVLCQIFTDFKDLFTDSLSNKPCLIWLLKIAPHLNYVTAVPCNLSLITALVCDCRSLSYIIVSRGSAAKHMKCAEIFSKKNFAANLLENLKVKKIESRLRINRVTAVVAWHSGRTSVSGRRTFPVLRLTCS